MIEANKENKNEQKYVYDSNIIDEEKFDNSIKQIELKNMNFKENDIIDSSNKKDVNLKENNKNNPVKKKHNKRKIQVEENKQNEKSDNDIIKNIENSNNKDVNLLNKKEIEQMIKTGRTKDYSNFRLSNNSIIRNNIINLLNIDNSKLALNNESKLSFITK